MAFKQVSTLKDNVAGILSGLNINTVADLDATLERGFANMLTRCYVPEASGIQNINLFSGVINYPIDPNIYEADLVDIRPQGNERPIWDFTVKTNQSNFDRTKGYFRSGTRAAFQYENGTPIIRIVAQDTTPQVILSTMNSTTGWTAGGTASSLSLNQASGWIGQTSLKCNVTTGTGTITNSTLTSADLTSYEGIGTAFLAVYIPSTTNLTSITLKLGSDASNYYSVTSTAGFTGAWTPNNWLLVPFDFSTASTTGTPDWSDVTYAQVSIIASGTETNFGLGYLFIAQPCPHQILYQSAAIFLASGTTTPTQTITADTDEIILNTSPYNIYVYEAALAVLENTSGGAGDAMYARIQQRLGVDNLGNVVGGLYKPYMADNPSEQIRQFNTYYGVRNNWWWGNGSAGF